MRPPTLQGTLPPRAFAQVLLWAEQNGLTVKGGWDALRLFVIHCTAALEAAGQVPPLSMEDALQVIAARPKSVMPSRCIGELAKLLTLQKGTEDPLEDTAQRMFKHGGFPNLETARAAAKKLLHLE